jgi:hypothetical protein
MKLVALMEKDMPLGLSEPTTTQGAEPRRSSETKNVEGRLDGGEVTQVLSGPPYSIFSPAMKGFIVAAVSVSALISPFGATTFYPALNVLAAQLNVTPASINLSLTTYMVCCPEANLQNIDLLICHVDCPGDCAFDDCWDV